MLDVSEVQVRRFRRWWGMTDCEVAHRAAAARGEAVPGSGFALVCYKSHPHQ